MSVFDEIKKFPGEATSWVTSKFRGATPKSVGMAAGETAGKTVNAGIAAADATKAAATEAAGGWREGYKAGLNGGASPAATDYAGRQGAAAAKAQAEMFGTRSPPGPNAWTAPGTAQPTGSPAGIRTGPSNPISMTDAVKPAERVSGSLRSAAVPEAPSGGVRNFAGKAAGVLGLGAGGVFAANRVSKGQTPEQQDGGSLGGLRGTFAEYGDNALLGYGREAGTAAAAGLAGAIQADPPDTLTWYGKTKQRLDAGLEGMKTGWNDAEAAEAKAYGNAPPPTPPIPPNDGPYGPNPPNGPTPPIPPVPLGQNVGGAVETVQGLRSAENVATGPYVQPLDGQGAIKFGNRPAMAINAYDPNGNTAQAPKRSNKGLNLREFFGSRIGTPAGALSALQAYGATSRMAEKGENAVQKRADLGLRSQANDNEAMKIRADMLRANTAAQLANRKQVQDETKENEVRRDKQIERLARESIAPGGSNWMGVAEKPEVYNQKLAQRTAKLRGDADVGMRSRGKDLETATTQDVQEMAAGFKMRDRLESKRSNWANYARDFFGNSRTDSRNPYSYIPTKVERSSLPFQGGYVVVFPNGNKMSISQASDGGFNWTEPNEPVDADMMPILNKLVKDFEEGSKPKKGLR